jgi:hypothetical protein
MGVARTTTWPTGRCSGMRSRRSEAASVRAPPLGTGRPAVSACVQASSAASVSVSVSVGRARARRRGASPGAHARARVAPSAVRGPSLRRLSPSCPCQRPPAGRQRPTGRVPRAVAPAGRPGPAALAARRDRRRPAEPRPRRGATASQPGLPGRRTPAGGSSLGRAGQRHRQAALRDSLATAAARTRQRLSTIPVVLATLRALRYEDSRA